MFPEAVARYHDLLANHDLAESSRATLDDGLERAKLIFGGRRLSTLYITTSRSRLSRERLNEAPLSGSIFALPLAVRGQAETPFAG